MTNNNMQQNPQSVYVPQNYDAMRYAGTPYATENGEMQTGQMPVCTGMEATTYNAAETGEMRAARRALEAPSNSQTLYPRAVGAVASSENEAFLPGYLKRHIGKWMRVEFLLGGNLVRRVGQLIDVGASFIVLKMYEANTTMVCDLYSIKFITILYDKQMSKLFTL